MQVIDACFAETLKISLLAERRSGEQGRREELERTHFENKAS
jgi:hypothetical protein